MMCRIITAILLLVAVSCLCNTALAVRLEVTPNDTGSNSGDIEFFNFDISPDGSTIVTNALFNTSLDAGDDDRLYAFPVPSAGNEGNPVTIGNSQQISTTLFNYNYIFSTLGPVISPNGQHVLGVHDHVVGSPEGPDTIAIIPIGGEGAVNPTPILSTTDNLIANSTSSIDPRYSPSGDTIYFLATEAGTTGGDVLYSLPANAGVPTGAAPTAFTSLTDDLEARVFDVNATRVIYSPNQRNQIFSIPTGGGAATEIPIAPAPTGASFDINSRLQLAADGQSIYFIGDYDNAGQNELYNLPITGGTPTKISDVLPADGNVTDFEISPDGTHIVYRAGQNDAATHELFYARVDGNEVVTGKQSIRVSDAPTASHGGHDVNASGSIKFIDNSRIAYIGDLNTKNVGDFYIVDTTEKSGLVPTSDARFFTYVGLDGGTLTTDTNWARDSDGVTAPEPGALTNDIGVNLTIDGNSVQTTDVDFGDGGFGTLTLTNGASLTVTLGGDVDFDADSTLIMNGNSTITTPDDVFLDATVQLQGGTITASGDDLQMRVDLNGIIDGTTLIAADGINFEGVSENLTIINATLDGGLIEMDNAFDNLIVTDTTIIARGGALDTTGTPGEGDVLDEGGNDSAGTITLMGSSTMTVDDLLDGVALVIDDSSSASIGNLTDSNGGDFAYIGFEGTDDNLGSTATLLSADASLSVPALASITGIDPRDFIINGLTGMTYNEDPDAWNVTDWDGLTAETLSIEGQSGDFDGDGDVDGADFLAWQRTDGTAEGLAAWQDAYPAGSGLSSAAAVPEPSAMLSFIATSCAVLSLRKLNRC